LHVQGCLILRVFGGFHSGVALTYGYEPR